jgi:hypothetical protein
MFLKIFERSMPGPLCNISYDNYMEIAGSLIFFMLDDRDTTVNILEFLCWMTGILLLIYWNFLMLLF